MSLSFLPSRAGCLPNFLGFIISSCDYLYSAYLRHKKLTWVYFWLVLCLFFSPLPLFLSLLFICKKLTFSSFFYAPLKRRTAQLYFFSSCTRSAGKFFFTNTSSFLSLTLPHSLSRTHAHRTQEFDINVITPMLLPCFFFSFKQLEAS